MEEVAGGWRRLHNEKLLNLYASPNNIRVIKLRAVKWVGYVAGMEEITNACNILVGKPEERRPLGKPKCRWEDIRKNLKQIG